MSRIKLDYVQAFVDRHGRVRHYFRRHGFPRVPLPGSPGSEAFMLAYQQALPGVAVEPPAKAANRTQPGTVNAAIIGFYQSPGFLSLRPVTKAGYRNRLEAFRVQHGDKRIAALGRNHVTNLLAEKAGKPGAQLNMLRMLKMLLAFAVDAGMRPDNPTAGVRLAAAKGDGFHSWTESEIERFEAHHAIGTRARLALALLLYTAQRRSDVIRMGRQHVRDGMLHVTQSKTGVPLAIPVHPTLVAVIAATPSGNLSFLTTQSGQPFTSAV